MLVEGAGHWVQQEKPGEVNDALLASSTAVRDEALGASARPGVRLMRAAVLRAGEIVVRDDVPEPVPGSVRCWCEVKACGICGSDLHFAKHGADLLALGRRMRGLRPDRRDPDHRPRP